MAAEQPGLGLYLAVPLAAADCGADYSLQLLLSLRHLSLGIPFTGVTWASYQTINVLGQFSTAVGLTLVQSAYTAEIIRGGFLGVDHGQYEAAAALGLPAWRRTLRIILPQALRAPSRTGFNEIQSGQGNGDGVRWRCRSCSTPSR
jgi:ABC-type amino acid transport system permease subunit